MAPRNEQPRSAVEMVARVRSGDLRPSALVKSALARTREIEGLNAFVLVDHAGARAAAADSDARAAAGHAGPLEGVPVAIKDFTPTRGHLTTRGSWSTGDHVPDEDPVIVQRLKAAGAVIIGKTTTPEFAYSSYTHSPRWGITRNPHDPERTPGGSSGGSGCAVATGCVPLAEGTDMGGSVRIPAALSGVVGLKPSLGRIPMDILPTVFDNISHFGPLASCVDDAALFLSVTQGPDDADIQSQPNPGRIDVPVEPSVEGLRFALSTDLGYYAVDTQVAARVEAAAEALERRGARIERVDPPWSRRINDTWLEIWGVTLAAAWGDRLAEYRDRMDPNVVALIEGASDTSAVAFKRIEHYRTQLWRELRAILAGHDALLTPTCANVAPGLDTADKDFEVDLPDGRFAGLDMCCPFNLVPQCPAISVPVGPAHGLPVGLQIVGRRFADEQVLRIAKAVELDHPPAALDGDNPALSRVY
jgi:amidase/aspartyl-tRNA(Asn)/glutamyl-tRNA(Gln) amidotransferase subunit A